MIRVGTDIIEIDRVKKNLDNPMFLKRIFSEKERELFSPVHHHVQSLAARFCAKEALIKVFGESVPFCEISILSDEGGRPFYELTGSAETKRQDLSIEKLDVSLSHCKTYAVAFAIGEIGE